MPPAQDFQKRIGRIEGLVQTLEKASDPALRRQVKELMECLMELHGAGLDRILELAAGAGNDDLIRSLGDDPLVGSLLVLYGLHPDDFETRVRRGLEKSRPALRAQDAHLEVVSVDETVVHVKIVGGRGDLERGVREAIMETAPDVIEIRIDGGRPAAHDAGFVPLSDLRVVAAQP